ncbi:MAG: hypothetical protein QG612_1385, partial [Pseudomonadota bacterium]|nr:hypothetical protein [Pseudomonadota bacterium]
APTASAVVIAASSSSELDELMRQQPLL